jgi:hypothetical protein
VRERVDEHDVGVPATLEQDCLGVGECLPDDADPRILIEEHAQADPGEFSIIDDENG